jgi:hypothetical protein
MKDHIGEDVFCLDSVSLKRIRFAVLRYMPPNRFGIQTLSYTLEGLLCQWSGLQY